MMERLKRKLFLGFIQLHILHHASIEPIYGVWMIEELASHGYTISPGSLYPLLHQMEEDRLLTRFDKKVDGRIRKYYNITPLGKQLLIEGKKQVQELIREMKEEKHVSTESHPLQNHSVD